MQNQRLVTEMTIYKKELIVPPDDIFDVHEFLKNTWDENSQLAPADRYSIETAIIELATNIFLYSEVTGRISCEIVVEIHSNKVSVTMTDNGDLADLEFDEHVMPDEFSESGRGIPLVRALVDHFSYENTDRKNTWKISKKIHS